MTGAQFRDYRKRLRLSQTGLALVFGVTRQHLNNIESGRVAVPHALKWSLVGVACQLDEKLVTEIVATIERKKQ
jgi:DNA-binding XRE family transcriptional regulator